MERLLIVVASAVALLYDEFHSLVCDFVKT
jgi:hypothetical protein